MADDLFIKLRDGRQLCYTEHGDLSGKPVFFLHGNPGSRWMRHPDETIAQSLGARIITPDRPGYGCSDFQPNRRLLDMPDDIAQLADALGIEQFAVFGVSAGGPYVAAIAYALPQRVTMAAIVSGAAPFDRDNPYEGVNETYTQAYKMAKLPAWMLTPLMGLATRTALRDRDAEWQGVMQRASRDDAQVLSQPAIKQQVQSWLPESVRQAGRGRVHEARLLVSPWGFELEQIQPTVHLWYWQGDQIVPPQMGRYLEAHMPHTVPHFLPDGGHFSIYTHWREILTPLVQAG